MAKKKKEPISDATLASIRESIAKIDSARLVPSLSDEQRELLELSAVTLKEAERTCIAKLENKILDALTDGIEPLRLKGKEIRARVTRMGKVPQALDAIEDVMVGVVALLKGVGKWKI